MCLVFTIGCFKPNLKAVVISHLVCLFETPCRIIFLCSRGKETRSTSQNLLIKLTNWTKPPHSLSNMFGIEIKINFYSSCKILACDLQELDSIP